MGQGDELKEHTDAGLCIYICIGLNIKTFEPFHNSCQAREVLFTVLRPDVSTSILGKSLLLMKKH